MLKQAEYSLLVLNVEFNVIKVYFVWSINPPQDLVRFTFYIIGSFYNYKAHC